MLRLHDTGTGEVRPLELRDEGRVSLYVCGPTVYDTPHLGHGRFALVFDVLRRYLEWRGLEVIYVSNITDIDDKIIARAASEHRSEAEVAQQFEASWWDAMDRLGVKRPSHTPHATAYVDQMIELVSELLGRGLAYVSPGGVYLSVEAVDGYGLLGHQSLDSLRSGARVEPDSSKRSPLDFALWKAAKPGEPSWDSPFGPGRPGWHTECVVMSLGLLGEDFDIHGGAIDLIFPHHENERAQAVALGRRFARHWVHNGWVEVGGEKMSKSLGNFTSLDDLLARTDARAYRLLVLRSHYRSPIEVTPRTVADAEEALARLDGIARRFGLAGGPPGGPRPATAPHGVSRMGRQRPDVPGAGTALEAAASYVERFVGHMDDDLDTPGALAGIFELARAANAAADAGDGTGAEILASTAQDLCSALGLELSPGSQEVDALSAGLAAERDQARARRDFQRADELREQLAELGWTVEDSQEGTRLRRSDRPGAS